MKLAFTSWLGALVVLGFAITSSLGTSSPDKILKDIQEGFHLPALAYAVLKDGQVKEVRAAGLRHVYRTTPVTINDNWHQGSCGKAMTSTMLARLVEKGVLQWNTTLRSVFGRTHHEFANVTLQQLLTHTSGIVYMPDASYLDCFRLPEPSKQLACAAERVINLPPEKPPGTELSYSNFGYNVAAAMAERVTRKSFARLMDEEVFGPLGIKGYGFGSPGKCDADDERPWGDVSDPDEGSRGKPGEGPWGDVRKPGEGPWGDVRRPREGPWGHIRTPGNGVMPAFIQWPIGLAADGDFHMSLQDWARFAHAHLQGGRSGLLTQKTFDRLHTPVIKPYAFGWSIMNLSKGKKFLLHDGSNGLYNALAILNREAGTAVLFATNVANGTSPDRGVGKAFSALMAKSIVPRLLPDRDWLKVI